LISIEGRSLACWVGAAVSSVVAAMIMGAIDPSLHGDLRVSVPVGHYIDAVHELEAKSEFSRDTAHECRAMAWCGASRRIG
jgi:hypothetical protein